MGLPVRGLLAGGAVVFAGEGLAVAEAGAPLASPDGGAGVSLLVGEAWPAGAAAGSGVLEQPVTADATATETSTDTITVSNLAERIRTRYQLNGKHRIDQRSCCATL